MEWISVNDRLPEPDSCVLVAYDLLELCFKKNRKIASSGHVGCKRYYTFFPNFFKWDDEDYHQVTHWMPLPEPPTNN